MPGRKCRYRLEAFFISFPKIAQFRRVDIATALYLLLVAAIVFLYGPITADRVLLVCTHLLLSALIILFPRFRGKVRRQPLAFLMDWYPVLAFPILYKQVEFLAKAFGDWRLTQVIPRWEGRIFDGYPHVWLSDAFPSVLLSEYLHFCYFFYILLLPVIGGYWYFRGRRIEFRELLFLMAATCNVSFLFYILYPVDSPYYLASSIDGSASKGFFFNLVHFVSEWGGARGGAFPSLHVSATTVVLLTALRHQRKLGYFLFPVAGGIYFSTVYGRFHYALDAIAGIALGILVVVVYRFSKSRLQTD